MNVSSAEFDRSAPDLDSCPDESLPEFAFIGRSNVGKSSLVNLLLGKRELAKVSATPGHTKMINFYNINRTWRLVDLPGYGFAEVARKNREKFSEAVGEYLANRPNLAGIFLLIDSRHPPQKLDLEFVHWLGRCAAPFALVFTKTDKASPTRVQTNITAFLASLAPTFDTLPEVYTTSVVQRTGRTELLEVIGRAIAQAPAPVAAPKNPGNWPTT
ncbi:MAG TPA: ribosome biogenesis GTP-binding protein YihA/YsxC [Candidatus Limnocylindria bacterium]|jgi:GTP-binding protein|nr:ribosome biogenesis GTP-binding protein YihA/YsxC [Candidatus Limnocylindria bacterium]